MSALSAFVRIEPGLLEEAVFLALRGRPEWARFQRQRTPLYGLADPDEREGRFHHLNMEWFLRLGLEGPLRQALDEQPLIGARARGCLVARRRGPREEGADLHVERARVGAPSAPGPGGGDAMLVVHLQPESFAVPGRLLAFLRRELLHVADTIDPGFGYQPRLAAEDPDPARQRLVLDRYAALWRATVGGRLARRGLADPDEERACRRAVERAFGGPGPRGAQLFERFFADDAPTHERLAACARDPQRALPAEGSCEMSASREPSHA